MIVVVGMSHRSAPIEVRERLALPSHEIGPALTQLKESCGLGEALIVSTCNRFEVVAAGPESTGEGLERIALAATHFLERRLPDARRFLYSHLGPDAIRHLFRVAASLDSLVLGEPQILGQLKLAFDLAGRQGTLGAQLNRVVPRAIRAAKRVRRETTIGAGQVSVPSVALDLARQIFGSLDGRCVALIGSGDMGEASARLLAQAGARVVVVGRTPERVEALARSLGAVPRMLDALGQTLEEADVVLTATSAPGFVIERDVVASALRGRRGRGLFLIDLAVPRDIDPSVDQLESVYLYNVDDLSQIVAESMDGRRREAALAEDIVASEVLICERSVTAQQVKPSIVALRRRFAQVFAAELERSMKGRLRTLGPDEREGVERMTEAALKKLLHAPSVRLRELASDDASADRLEGTLEVLGELFDLGAEEPMEES